GGTRPAHSAMPDAAAGGLAPPGRLPTAAPASQEAKARTAIAPNMTVRWAASFSTARRRLLNGEAATRSRLPLRASAASVPESARIDQREAAKRKTGPYFHIT